MIAQKRIFSRDFLEGVFLQKRQKTSFNQFVPAIIGAKNVRLGDFERDGFYGRRGDFLAGAKKLGKKRYFTLGCQIAKNLQIGGNRFFAVFAQGVLHPLKPLFVAHQLMKKGEFSGKVAHKKKKSLCQAQTLQKTDKDIIAETKSKNKRGDEIAMNEKKWRKKMTQKKPPDGGFLEAN